METRKILALVFLVVALSVNAFSQSIGINADGTAPAGCAIIDVSATNKGFLLPRMTLAQRTAISSPVAGLMVFCTNCGTAGELQVYNGTIWTNVAGGNASASKPDAPTIGIATAGQAKATVTFTKPSSNGGSTITSYTATSSPGGITGTLAQSESGTITVTGLTAGIAYTFTVTATNASATGPASAASNSVTPIAVIADGSGNSYEGVTIGTQIWMAKNLNTTNYSDVTAIPNVTVDATWSGLTTGADNTSGFTAVPGGYRKADGTFQGQGGAFEFWVTTAIDAINGKEGYFVTQSTSITSPTENKKTGSSVCCLMG